MFLANYADVLTDLPLNDMIDEFKASDAVGSLVAVPPQSAFHCVEVDDEGNAHRHPLAAAAAAVGERRLLRAAPGDLRPPPGERRPDRATPARRWPTQGRMLAYRHRGFWHPADTVKERTALEAYYRSGNCPWMLWETKRQRDPIEATIGRLLPAAIEHEHLTRRPNPPSSAQADLANILDAAASRPHAHRS